MGLKRRQFLAVIGAGSLGAGMAGLRVRSQPQGAAIGAIETRASRLAATPPLSSPPLSTSGVLAQQRGVGPSGWFTPILGDLRLAVISDLNGPYGSTTYDPEVIEAISLLPQWQPDGVLCAGDMVAGQDLDLSREQVIAMWQGFEQAIRKPIRQMGLPFGFTLGNHDASASRQRRDGQHIFQMERELAASYWRNPRHETGLQIIDRGDFPFYYSFQLSKLAANRPANSGETLFCITWDASSSLIPDAQLAWAERTLASPAAQSAGMRLVFGHIPLYAVARGRDAPGEVLANADRLRAMLERYRVHTYISGHHHAYYPGHVGQLELLFAGALGSGPRQLLKFDRPSRKTLTIVDITLANQTTVYTTYDMRTRQVITLQELPRQIDGHSGRVWRRDLPIDKA